VAPTQIQTFNFTINCSHFRAVLQTLTFLNVTLIPPFPQTSCGIILINQPPPHLLHAITPPTPTHSPIIPTSYLAILLAGMLLITAWWHLTGSDFIRSLTHERPRVGELAVTLRLVSNRGTDSEVLERWGWADHMNEVWLPTRKHQPT
jgi:hypothetical protein